MTRNMKRDMKGNTNIIMECNHKRDRKRDMIRTMKSNKKCNMTSNGNNTKKKK